MKYIRIKVKHLIILAILLVGSLFFSNTIFWNGVKLYNRIAPADYEISVKDVGDDSLSSEKSRLALILSENEYNLYELVWISDGMMAMGGSRVRYQDAINALDQFYQFNEVENLFIKEPDYVLDMILLQCFAGNNGDAKVLLENLSSLSLTEKQSNRLALIKTAIALSEYRLEDVDANLKEVTLDSYQSVVMAVNGFVEKFYRNNNEVDLESIPYDDVDNDRYTQYFSSIFEILEGTKFEANFPRENNNDPNVYNKISGRVTLNGQGVAGVFIYPFYHRGISSSEGFDSETIVTDSNGYYEYINRSSDFIGIRLVLPWQKFNDKQMADLKVVDWEAPIIENYDYKFAEGAKLVSAEIDEGYFYYKISDSLAKEDRSYHLYVKSLDENQMNSYSFFSYDIPFNELEGKIPMSALHKETDFRFNYTSSKNELDVWRFIEPLYLTGNYYFGITPQEGNGESYINNGIVSDALGVDVSYKGMDGFSEGDKLIEAGRFDEAKTWYADNLSEHGLKILVALYERGDKVIETKKFEQILGGEDPEKAIEYLKQLMSSYGNSRRRMGKLRELYGQLGDLKKQEEVLLETLKEYDDVYNYFSLAYNYFDQGRYEDGINVLLEHGEVEIYGERYYSYFIIGNQWEALPEKFRDAFKKMGDSESFDPFFNLIREGRNEEAYNWLMSAEKSELRQFYLMNFFDSFTLDGINFEQYKLDEGIETDIEFHDYYRDQYNEAKKPAIKKLYVLLKNDWGWIH